MRFAIPSVYHFQIFLMVVLSLLFVVFEFVLWSPRPIIVILGCLALSLGWGVSLAPFSTGTGETLADILMMICFVVFVGTCICCLCGGIYYAISVPTGRISPIRAVFAAEFTMQYWHYRVEGFR